MNKLVSILTPCYKVEKYIGRFIDSVIAQDYRPIELVLVNDGSPDQTENVILSKKEELESSGISLIYLKKKNGGQASATALGLPHVSGAYLTWPDSDDFLLPHSIKKRVEYLEANPNCAIVRCNGYIYSEEDCGTPISELSKIKKQTQMMDFVNFRVTWAPGCYMVRMSAFDKANPQRYIYNSAAGQNIQMLLPVVFRYPCDYLDEYLFGYLLRSSSHSHSIVSYEEKMNHFNRLSDCVFNTLAVIDGDTERYLEAHKKTAYMWKLRLAWECGKKADFDTLRRAYCGKGIEIMIMSLLPPTRFSFFLVHLICGIRQRIMNANQ